MYGAVVCSRCRRAQAVDLRNKTARCQCGNRIKIKEAKRFFESSSQREVAAAVARLNAELKGGTEEWEKIAEEMSGTEATDPYSRIVLNASSVTNPEEKLGIVVRGLSDAFESFSREQLEKALRMLAIKNVEECIKGLLRENIIYEPRKDVFRAV